MFDDFHPNLAFGTPNGVYYSVSKNVTTSYNLETRIWDMFKIDYTLDIKIHAICDYFENLV